MPAASLVTAAIPIFPVSGTVSDGGDSSSEATGVIEPT